MHKDMIVKKIHRNPVQGKKSEGMTASILGWVREHIAECEEDKACYGGAFG